MPGTSGVGPTATLNKQLGTASAAQDASVKAAAKTLPEQSTAASALAAGPAPVAASASPAQSLTNSLARVDSIENRVVRTAQGSAVGVAAAEQGMGDLRAGYVHTSDPVISAQETQFNGDAQTAFEGSVEFDIESQAATAMNKPNANLPQIEMSADKQFAQAEKAFTTQLPGVATSEDGHTLTPLSQELARAESGVNGVVSLVEKTHQHVQPPPENAGMAELSNGEYVTPAYMLQQDINAYSGSTPAITGSGQLPNQNPPAAKGEVTSETQAAQYWVSQGGYGTCSSASVDEALRQLGHETDATSPVRLGANGQVVVPGVTSDVAALDKKSGDASLGQIQRINEEQNGTGVLPNGQLPFVTNPKEGIGVALPALNPDLQGGDNSNIERAITAEGAQYREIPANATSIEHELETEHDPVLISGAVNSAFWPGIPATGPKAYHMVEDAGFDPATGKFLINDPAYGTHEVSAAVLNQFTNGISGVDAIVVSPKAAPATKSQSGLAA